MQKSTKDLKGNTIVATDGDIGKVNDFYFDDKSWTIRYLVADTGNWLLGRKVLLSPIAVGKADFSSGRFNVRFRLVSGHQRLDRVCRLMTISDIRPYGPSCHAALRYQAGTAASSTGLASPNPLDIRATASVPRLARS